MNDQRAAIDTAAATGTPCASVVVPVYNSADHLGQCLESVLSQTMADLELICVDDGSTDSSPDLLRAFAERDRRMRVLTQGNAGPGAARNRGMDAARGRYLYFLDADDYLHGTFLEKAVARADEQAADVVVARFRLCHQEIGVEVSPEWTLNSRAWPDDAFDWRANPDELFQTFHNYPWNKLVRTDFARSEGIRFQEIHLTEDLMFAAGALTKAKRITCLDEALIVHREGTGTNTMASKHKHPTDFVDAFAATRAMLEEQGDYTELERGFIAWALNACRYNLLTIGDYGSFREVIDHLAESGLDAMGITDALDTLGEADARFIALIRERACDVLLFEEYRELRLDHDKCVNWAISELEAKWTALDRAGAAERERDALNARIEELRRSYEASLDMRVGRAALKIPRAIKHAIERND